MSYSPVSPSSDDIDDARPTDSQGGHSLMTSELQREGERGSSYEQRMLQICCERKTNPKILQTSHVNGLGGLFCFLFRQRASATAAAVGSHLRRQHESIFLVDGQTEK